MKRDWTRKLAAHKWMLTAGLGLGAFVALALLPGDPGPVHPNYWEFIGTPANPAAGHGSAACHRSQPAVGESCT